MDGKGPFAQCIHAARHALSYCFHIAPPSTAIEVLGFMEQLHMSNRDILNFYRIFQNLREFDPLTKSTLTNEVCSSSVIQLVRNDKEWVVKILYNLLELGGYTDIVTWDGFLWVLLQFCTLSKLELAQVLFYMIAKEMKSWTLHLLTNSQLEEFFEDWVDCPILSFDCSDLKFDSLPKTKYSMIDFIHLTTRYGALINPVIHLQRSLQQSLPSLSYWGDYDRIKLKNRFIPLDFFRYRKTQNIMELIHESSVKDMERDLVMAKLLIGDDNLKALKREHLGHDSVLGKNAPKEYKGLPLPGSQKRKQRGYRQIVDPTPKWIKDINAGNMDPVKGTNLGSAVPPIPKELLPQPDVAKLIVTIRSANGLPLPTYSCATCEIEGRPATQVRTQTVFGTDPVWKETHAIYGYIVDDSKSLEFCIRDSSLLVKLLMPQRRFYPHGYDGFLSWTGGKIDVKVEVTLPKTVDDARDMVLSTFGEETRLAQKANDLKAVIEKLKIMKTKKEAINRVQELDFIRSSRDVVPRQQNIVKIMERSCPCELVDRPRRVVLGRRGKDVPY